jgi:hypothetical protein
MIYRRNDLPPTRVAVGSYPATSDVCFHCSKSISAPHAIEWHGAVLETRGSAPSIVSIWLHPGCAQDFLLRLARDIHAVQTAEGTETFMREPRERQ